MVHAGCFCVGDYHRMDQTGAVGIGQGTAGDIFLRSFGIADNGGFFTDKANAELIPKDSPEVQGQTTFGRQHVDYFLQIAHKYRGGTNVAKVDIILHELSHAVGVAELDYNNTAAGNRNDKRILDNCSKTLKQAEKYKGVL